MNTIRRTIGTGLLAGAIACSCTTNDADGKGTVTFTTWGEEYIEQGIPPMDADGRVVVEDGWTIAFDKFLVVISDVSVAEEGKAPVATLAVSKLFDMHLPGEKLVASFPDLPAKAYSNVSWAIAPATSTTELGPGTTDADRAMMVEKGHSIWVSATASKGSVSKKIAWGFTTSTLYDRCKAEKEGREVDGVVVTNGGTDSVQLTIHGDHLFYDDLQSPDAKVRFDAIANADADGDGEVTLEELAAVDLADPSKIAVGTYGTGSAAGIHDLRAFVEALSRTIGHFRGEGECVTRPR
jgi:hypothetical protein